LMACARRPPIAGLAVASGGVLLSLLLLLLVAW
jgi:hypothetical protein